MVTPIDWEDADISVEPGRKFVTPLEWWRNRKKKAEEK